MSRFQGAVGDVPRVHLSSWSCEEKADEKADQSAEAEAAKNKRISGKTDQKGQEKPKEEKETGESEEAKKLKEMEEAQEREEQEQKRNRTAVFWRVQGFTHKQKKPEEFNMEVGHITVDAWGQILEQSRNIGAKQTAKPDFAQSAILTKTIIPVLTNKKDVLINDLLIYQKLDAPKAEAPTKPVKLVSQRPLLERMLAGATEGESAAKQARIV